MNSVGPLKAETSSAVRSRMTLCIRLVRHSVGVVRISHLRRRSHRTRLGLIFEIPWAFVGLLVSASLISSMRGVSGIDCWVYCGAVCAIRTYLTNSEFPYLIGARRAFESFHARPDTDGCGSSFGANFVPTSPPSTRSTSRRPSMTISRHLPLRDHVEGGAQAARQR